MTDSTDFNDFYDGYGRMWRPVERHGWTWVPTMDGSPETYSLFDSEGELMGAVHQRFNRVICWAPFTWAEEAYRSHEDVGEYGFDTSGQRLRHFMRIGESLRGWVGRKRADGVDLALLRDTHACYFETCNGHHPMTMDEFNLRDYGPHPDPPPSLDIDGWRAERAFGWHCERWRLRDPSGRMRGNAQVRFGVVRAVAAQAKDADKVDPLRGSHREHLTCRGQIVLQERLRSMASAFEPGEREAWVGRAVEAVRSTPNPDRSWPPETLGAWGSPGRRMFPASRRR